MRFKDIKVGMRVKGVEDNDFGGGEGIITKINEYDQIIIKLTKDSRGYKVGEETCWANWCPGIEPLLPQSLKDLLK